MSLWRKRSEATAVRRRTRTLPSRDARHELAWPGAAGTIPVTPHGSLVAAAATAARVKLGGLATLTGCGEDIVIRPTVIPIQCDDDGSAPEAALDCPSQNA